MPVEIVRDGDTVHISGRWVGVDGIGRIESWELRDPDDDPEAFAMDAAYVIRMHKIYSQTLPSGTVKNLVFSWIFFQDMTEEQGLPIARLLGSVKGFAERTVQDIGYDDLEALSAQEEANPRREELIGLLVDVFSWYADAAGAVDITGGLKRHTSAMA